MPGPVSLTAIPGGSPASALATQLGLPASRASVLQTSTASSAVSGPTTYTHTFAASTPGSQLFFAVCVVGSAATAIGPLPAGWVQIWANVTATCVVAVLALPPALNPGALTTVTLSGPTATTGGIASVVVEATNCPFPSDTGANVNNNQNSTGANSGGGLNSLSAGVASNDFVVGAVGWVLGAATMTLNNLAPASGWVNAAQATSTNGTTNAALQVGYINGTSVPANTSTTGFRYGGTLSGASQWCGGVSTCRTLASDQPVGIATGIAPVDTICSTGPVVVGNG